MAIGRDQRGGKELTGPAVLAVELSFRESECPPRAQRIGGPCPPGPSGWGGPCPPGTQRAGVPAPRDRAGGVPLGRR